LWAELTILHLIAPKQLHAMGIDDSVILIRCIFPSLDRKYLPRAGKSWTGDLQIVDNFFCGIVVANSRRLDYCAT